MATGMNDSEAMNYLLYNDLDYNIINPETRTITVAEKYKLLGVESDEKAKRVYFKCPKIVDDIDLSTMHIYVNYQNANGEKNSYLVEDAVFDDDNVIFSWLMSRHVFAYRGTVSYIVCAKKSEETDILNEWNTRIATGTVVEGLEATQEIEEQDHDIIEQLLTKVKYIEEHGLPSSDGRFYRGDFLDLSTDGEHTIEQWLDYMEFNDIVEVVLTNNYKIMLDINFALSKNVYGRFDILIIEKINNDPSIYQMELKSLDGCGGISCYVKNNPMGYLFYNSKNITEGGYDTVTLQHGRRTTIYRSISGLFIRFIDPDTDETISENIYEGFTSTLEFTHVNTETTNMLEYPVLPSDSRVYYRGDHVESGILRVRTDHRYVLDYYFDGIDMLVDVKAYYKLP